MQTKRLVIFLKAPRLGTVKTRLAATLGDAAALQVHRALVEVVLRQLAPVPGVELRFTPDDACREISPWMRAGWIATPQGPGDLGQRLRRAFKDHFGSGAERVVVIGSDCPAVAFEDIRIAWAALRTDDVVIGPASDGGYWLIGLRESQPAVFRGIAWGTAKVLRQTLDRAEARGLRVHLLRELADVDTAVDWWAFLARSHGG